MTKGEIQVFVESYSQDRSFREHIEALSRHYLEEPIRKQAQRDKIVADTLAEQRAVISGGVSPMDRLRSLYKSAVPEEDRSLLPFERFVPLWRATAQQLQ